MFVCVCIAGVSTHTCTYMSACGSLIWNYMGEINQDVVVVMWLMWWCLLCVHDCLGWQSSAILGEGLLPQSSHSCVFILLFIGGCFFVGSFYTCRFTWFQLWNSEKIFSKFVLVFWHLNRGKKEVQETFYSIENNSKTNYSKLEMELKYSPSAVE